MTPFRRVATNTGILYGRMLITLGLSLYATRLTLIALGVEDFGIFSLVGGAVAMLTFLNASMAAATQRYMSHSQGQDQPERSKEIFCVSAALHITVSLVVAILLEIAHPILFSHIFQINSERLHAAQSLYQIVTVASIVSIATVPYDAVLNARENMLFYAAIGVLEAIAKVAIAFVINATSDDRLIQFGLLTLALTVAVAIAKMAFCHMRYPECTFDPRKSFRPALFRSISTFAGWSFLGSSTSFVSNYGQGILLNSYFGPTVNASHAISGQVAGQLGTLAGTMQRAITPLITRSEGSGDRSMMLRTAFVGSRVGLLMLTLFYVPAILEMPYILALWLKQPPEYAAIFCRLLLARSLCEQMTLTLVSSIAAVGNIRRYQIVTSIITLVPLPVSYVLFAAAQPPEALYLTYIAYTIATTAVILHYAREICGVSIQQFLTKAALPCVFIFMLCMIAAVVPVIAMDSSLSRLCTVIVLSSVTLLGMTWLIGLEHTERAAIKSISKVALLKITGHQIPNRDRG